MSLPMEECGSGDELRGPGWALASRCSCVLLFAGDSYLTAGAASGLRRWSRRGPPGQSQKIGGSNGYAWTCLQMVKDGYLLGGRSDGAVALFDLVRVRFTAARAHCEARRWPLGGWRLRVWPRYASRVCG